MSKSFPATSVVITNLRDATIGNVRMDCRAIVISDNPDLHDGVERRYSLNGYGVSCVWHVFELILQTPLYAWSPRLKNNGFPHPHRGTLRVTTPEGPTDIILSVENLDLEIHFETIVGSWTPNDERVPQDDDWFDYCQRIKDHVVDRGCAVVEALSFQRNVIIPITVLPTTARQILRSQ